MMPFIDTHYHLDKYRNHREMFSMINSLHQYTLCVTNSPGVFLSCRKLYEETKYIRFALGVHPLEIKDPVRSLFEFEHCLPQARYIGEVGLDYSQKSIERDSQLLVFDRIMHLQSIVNKPVSIHIRLAEDDAIQTLARYPNTKRVIHWFSGSSEQLSCLLSLGCYFSLNSAMIRTSKQIHQLKTIPHDRILIESDGPYTSIGRKNFTPDKLQSVYSTVGKCLDLPDIESIVYRNFQHLIQS